MGVRVPFHPNFRGNLQATAARQAPHCPTASGRCGTPPEPCGLTEPRPASGKKKGPINIPSCITRHRRSRSGSESPFDFGWFVQEGSASRRKLNAARPSLAAIQMSRLPHPARGWVSPCRKKPCFRRHTVYKTTQRRAGQEDGVYSPLSKYA